MKRDSKSRLLWLFADEAGFIGEGDELPTFGFDLAFTGADAAKHFVDIESALAGELFAMAMNFGDDFVCRHVQRFDGSSRTTLDACSSERS